MIGGGSASLPVANVATAPADELDYSFAAPAGFTAPGGTFLLNAGDPAASHAIATTTGPAGPRSGDLIVTSDDPDATTRNIALTATVLDHAGASLDSIDALTSDTLDFGTHPAGGFEDQLARVHNRGYHAYQARLLLNGAAITGGAGRFTLVETFAPSLVAEVARGLGVHFDDTGATSDSAYQATLTFTSADEPLPGATAQPDLLVTLSATVGSVVVSAPGVARPSRTALLAPFPNPLARSSTLAFELAAAGRARLEVFDLTGRRVATLADRRFEAGRHTYEWNGRGDDGTRAGAGLYFVRLSGDSLRPRSARLAIVR